MSRIIDNLTCNYSLLAETLNINVDDSQKIQMFEIISD